MSENEKKHDSQSCCCQSWKAILIAIAFMAIGAVFGHKMTMMHNCCHMRGPCGGGYGREVCRDRDYREYEGSFEHKFQEGKKVYGEQKGWFGHKADMGKCKPGCTCPICSKRAAGLSEPNKAGCPMMDKKEGKPRKN
ncbi:MAG: hypothetical protein NTW93_02185 [Phycisphaerae bacterium]|nr:hypothetical protein [Phycisphaerae bacterium]